MPEMILYFLDQAFQLLPSQILPIFLKVLIYAEVFRAGLRQAGPWDSLQMS